MNVRCAQESDLPKLAALYRQTILVNAPEHYTHAQTQIWASFSRDADQFKQFILGVTTFVAEDDSGILGFAGIGEEGHVVSTYVRQDYLRRGVWSILMQALEQACEFKLKRLYAEASAFSLGLFQKLGFQIYDMEVVDRQGVEFQRYLVELNL
ncbi:N-acetyltransferase family protein [Acaryochloris marina NIES-2412]|uniref:N-acetyltransferase family protein n=1 Tax=Acaryochloris marina TaxID=155978 RepID=UPI0040593518